MRALQNQQNYKGYSLIFVILTTLFCMRVLGQVLVAFFAVPYLPPMKAWMSGLMPYPILLPCQLLIIILLSKVCFDCLRGKGFALEAKPRLAKLMTSFGLIYMAATALRFAVFGASIPVLFHVVLAAFVLIYAHFQKRVCCEYR